MTDYHDLLIEICTEELPPKRLSMLEQAFFSSIKKQLQEAQLDFAEIKSFSTPRRLAVLVYQLAEQQPTQTIERKGPNVTQAYDAQGQLTPAGKGFLHSCGITQDQLSTIKTDKGDCLHFIGEKPGLDVTMLIPEIINTALKALPIPKPMRWGSNDFQFIRPVHSIIVLYGQNIIPVKLFGLESNRTSCGHRQMCHEEIVIGFPEQYETELEEKGFVVANAKKRQYIIVNQINSILENKLSEKALAKLDPDLLDEVTALVEWPKTLLCQFDDKFLTVPQEALIASMQGHQKCFPITDQNHQLLPYFLTVSNLDSKDESEVIRGNERVMRARLSDAKFFYETDLKTPINDYVDRAKSTIYHEKLGSIAGKVGRMTHLIRHHSSPSHTTPYDLSQAAQYCKFDLFSQMVGEFPELQGIMGKYYALHAGKGLVVAAAIEEHYWPRFADDKIPTAPVSVALALADRFDTLVGFFGIGLLPTGDKDPFALRRIASGILKIIIENQQPTNLEEAINATIKSFSFPVVNSTTNEIFLVNLTQKNLVESLLAFFKERFKTLALEKGISIDTFNAAMNVVSIANPSDVLSRMKAIQSFKIHEAAPALAQANKRVANLLNKSPVNSSIQLNTALFEKDIEKQLAQKINEANNRIQKPIEQANYTEALLQLAGLKPIIDQFFEEVMVMTEVMEKRNNRLCLLLQLRVLFLKVADLAELQL